MGHHILLSTTPPTGDTTNKTAIRKKPSSMHWYVLEQMFVGMQMQQAACNTNPCHHYPTITRLLLAPSLNRDMSCTVNAAESEVQLWHSPAAFEAL